MQRIIISVILILIASFSLFTSIESSSYILNWKKSYNNPISHISLSGSGKELLVAWNNKTEVLNNFSEVIFTYEFPAKISVAKISNNSNYIITCITSSCFLFKKSLNTYNFIKRVNFTASIVDMDISYDGSVIAIATNDNKLHLLNSSGFYITSPKILSSSPIKLVISGNSKFILVGMNNNKLALYDSKGNLQWEKTLNSLVKDMDISYKGDFIVLATTDFKIHFLYYDGTIIWSKNVIGLPYVISMDDYSNYIVVGTLSNYVYLYNNTGFLKHYEVLFNPINSLKISSNGKYFSVLDNGGGLYFYELGKKLWSYQLSDLGKKLDLSYDGSIVAAFSQDNKIFFFSVIFENTVTQTLTKTYTSTTSFYYTVYNTTTEYTTFLIYTTVTSPITSTRTVSYNTTITVSYNTTITNTVTQPLYENLALVIVLISVGVIFGLGLGYAIGRVRGEV